MYAYLANTPFFRHAIVWFTMPGCIQDKLTLFIVSAKCRHMGNCVAVGVPAYTQKTLQLPGKRSHKR